MLCKRISYPEANLSQTWRIRIGYLTISCTCMHACCCALKPVRFHLPIHALYALVALQVQAQKDPQVPSNSERNWRFLRVPPAQMWFLTREKTKHKHKHKHKPSDWLLFHHARQRKAGFEDSFLISHKVTYYNLCQVHEVKALHRSCRRSK